MSYSSSLLNSPFSDQSHLQFYKCGDGASLSVSSPSSSSRLLVLSRLQPLFQFKAALLPVRASFDCNTSCAGIQQTTEQSLMQELAQLKLQMEHKKRELKALKKEEKKRATKCLESMEEKKIRKIAKKGMKDREKKMKEGPCESSSSGSESSDGECDSLSMKTLKQGKLMDIGGTEAEKRGFMEDIVRMPSRCPLGCKDGVTQLTVIDMERKVETPAPMHLSGEDDSQSHLKMIPASSVSSKEAVGSWLGSHSGCPRPSHASNSVEVCAGGKCKKAGSEQLLLALRGQIPSSSDVVALPCKCMGKCGMAINVRVHREDTNPQHHSHVGVEDAGLILSRHFGLGRPASGLPICPSVEPRTAPLAVPAV